MLLAASPCVVILLTLLLRKASKGFDNISSSVIMDCTPNAAVTK